MTTRRPFPGGGATAVAIEPERIRPASWQSLDLHTIQRRLAEPPPGSSSVIRFSGAEQRAPGGENAWPATILAFPPADERIVRQHGKAGREQTGSDLVTQPARQSQPGRVPDDDLLPIGRVDKGRAAVRAAGRLRGFAGRNVWRSVLQLILLAVALLGAYYNGRAAGGFQRVIVVPPPQAAAHVIT